MKQIAYHGTSKIDALKMIRGVLTSATCAVILAAPGIACPNERPTGSILARRVRRGRQNTWRTFLYFADNAPHLEEMSFVVRHELCEYVLVLGGSQEKWSLRSDAAPLVLAANIANEAGKLVIEAGSVPDAQIPSTLYYQMSSYEILADLTAPLPAALSA
jgi:hypothetical protein